MGVFPSGTKNIYSNGTHNVKNYENVSVAVDTVAGFRVATGTLTATNNSYQIGFVPDIVQITMREIEQSGESDCLITCDFVFHGTGYRLLKGALRIDAISRKYAEIRCGQYDYSYGKGFSAVIDSNSDLIDRNSLTYTAIKFT